MVPPPPSAGRPSLPFPCTSPPVPTTIPRTLHCSLSAVLVCRSSSVPADAKQERFPSFLAISWLCCVTVCFVGCWLGCSYVSVLCLYLPLPPSSPVPPFPLNPRPPPGGLHVRHTLPQLHVTSSSRRLRAQVSLPGNVGPKVWPPSSSHTRDTLVSSWFLLCNHTR